MELQEAKEALDSFHPHKASAPLRLVIHQPGGIGGTPTVGVKAIHAGFDWDSNTILIYPEEQLTRLTPDEVAAITKSVSKGQSWHSYQEFKKYREQLAEATEEISRLRAELEKHSKGGSHD
ncbi:hypothetical protein [Enterobacter kobei]|uniref:hypothetical protein n=1 Tax=Enterobacter kobei TaxID=208224 RepID=UPI001BE13D5C|nr:hypothetical protein [Escherichia coli]